MANGAVSRRAHRGRWAAHCRALSAFSS
jgi:hypothetical protein